ncbi:MAG: sigma-70 family RNA polymerase sigma factor [Chloroflexi bacterium]|nr:sigma-70 family RNA polymerase sigma factor [Chloroflexota bacterium]
MLVSPRRDGAGANRPLAAQRQDVADAVPDLVRRAQRGEIAAFNTLVIRHQNAAYSLAFRFLRSREAAEDVTQESFVRAWRAIETFRGERFRSWLLRIVANAARDELRRRKRRPQRSLDEARDDPDMASIDPAEPGLGPQERVEQSELRAVLERALAELPEEWRMAVLLSDVHGMSYEEVSEATGVPLGTVKSRLSRARARLRDLLSESGELSGLVQRRNT